MPLKSYQEVLEELHDSKTESHVLFGNGFNLSLAVDTSYVHILEVMVEHNPDYRAVLQSITNLESFIGQCVSAVDQESVPAGAFLPAYIHSKIRLDFMKAVSEIVAGEIRGIYEEKNNGIYLLLRNFKSFFTLNYDPFLYQLLLHYQKDGAKRALVFQPTLPGIIMNKQHSEADLLEKIRSAHESGELSIEVSGETHSVGLGELSKTRFRSQVGIYFNKMYKANQIDRAVDEYWRLLRPDQFQAISEIDDGFLPFGSELKFSSPKTQNLFFLHGAFHIMKRGQEVYKIRSESESALYEKIEKMVEGTDQEVVCVLREEKKEDEIRQNPYLLQCLNALNKLSGNLVIIGSSIAPNDSHIFREIAKSQVGRIYLATSDKSAATQEEALRKFFPGVELVLFDQTSIDYSEPPVR